MGDVPDPVPPPLPAGPPPTLLGQLAQQGARIGAVTALALTAKYLAGNFGGSRELDLGGLIFLAAILLLPVTPFLAAAAAIARWRQPPLLLACLVFELLALASCWPYAQLAFRLVRPDALESLIFLFLPIYQFMGLGACLGLGALGQRWLRRRT